MKLKKYSQINKKKLIADALKELSKKNHHQIERETAFKWSARAIAAFQLSLNETSFQKRIKYLTDGEDYYRESLEHASMAGISNLGLKLHTWIDPYRKKAHKNLG